MTYKANESRYDNMQYRRCGASGIKLPAISLGLWHNWGDVDSYATAKDMTQRAFDLGIHHFDLANNYGPPPGSAETNFGKILKEKKKDVLAAKGGKQLVVPHEAWESD